jgi:hypothetical protein
VQRAPGIPHALIGRKINVQLGRIVPRGREAVFDEYKRAKLSTVIAREGGRSSIPELSNGIERLRRTGYSAFAEYDDQLWSSAATQTPSFRGDAKHRTRNLEIPGLVLRTIPE